MSTTTIVAKHLLGGPGNGREAPSDWLENSGLWLQGDRPAELYELRSYTVGAFEVQVWKYAAVSDELAQEIMQWFVPSFNQRVFDSQLILTKEVMGAAQQYLGVIMAVGYAALIAFWNGLRDHMTGGTLVAASILLFLSLATFVGWEVWGMFTRSRIVMDLALTVNDPPVWIRKLLDHPEKMAKLAARMAPLWHLVIIAAATTALGSAAIMLSVLVHGYAIGRF